MLGWLLGFEAGVWVERGDFTRAERLARESMEIAERIESPLSRGIPLGVLALVRAQQGDHAAAIAVAEQWIETTGRTLRARLPYALSTLATFHLARGASGEARRLADEALRMAETESFRMGQLAAELALARIELADAKPEDAAQRTLEATGQRVRLPKWHELRAELARQRGDAPGCAAALRDALALYQEMGAAGHAERVERAIAR